MPGINFRTFLDWKEDMNDWRGRERPRKWCCCDARNAGTEKEKAYEDTNGTVLALMLIVHCLSQALQGIFQELIGNHRVTFACHSWGPMESTHQNLSEACLEDFQSHSSFGHRVGLPTLFEPSLAISQQNIDARMVYGKWCHETIIWAQIHKWLTSKARWCWPIKGRVHIVVINHWLFQSQIVSLNPVMKQWFDSMRTISSPPRPGDADPSKGRVHIIVINHWLPQS